MIPAARKIDANAVVPGGGSPHPVVWGTIVTQASYLAIAARTNAARTAPKTLNAPPAATHGTWGRILKPRRSRSEETAERVRPPRFGAHLYRSGNLSPLVRQ